jgi:DNA polymerase-1
VVKTGWDFHNSVWHRAALVVSRMEAHGLSLDADLCRQREQECITQQQEIGELLNGWAGKEINWASPKQKAEFFYGDRGWDVPNTCGNVRAVKRVKPGARPTDEMAVLNLARSVPSQDDRHHLRLYCGYPDVKAKEHEVSWKTAEKLKGFYAGLPEHAAIDGRVHTQLGALTRTGRLASRNPNLQNVPPIVRGVFIAETGRTLVAYDFSSLEWRILAHIVAKRYGDSTLVEEIRQGRDPHQATADGMTERLGKPVSRAAAKIINYSINYGKTEKGLAIQLEVSEQEAGEMLEAFGEARPGVARWLDDAKDYVKTRAYCRTLLGRFLPIPEIKGNRWDRMAAERQALNYPIQGSAADIVSMAMIGCSEMFNQRLQGLGSRLLLQIHDELLFSVPEENAEEAGAEIEARMVGCLEGVTEFLCPLQVEGGSGERWGDC